MEYNKKINRFILIIQAIFCMSMFYGYTVRYGTTIGKAEAIVIMTMYVIIVLAEGFCYFKNKQGRLFSKVSLVGFLIAYAITLFTTNNDYIFMLVFVIIMPYLLYFDSKLILVATICNILINAISSAIQCINHRLPSGATFDIFLILTQVASVFVFSVASYIILKIIQKMNQEKIDAIQSEHSKAERLLENMISITNIVRNNAESVTTYINELDEATDNSVTTINNIASGNAANAESIGQQSVMTEQIQRMIEEARLEADNSCQYADTSSNKVHTGIQDITALKEKSSHVEAFNESMMTTIQTFVESTKEVKSITDGINTISAQTNLLALNASIESARAGEAGRGFAVVAEEIRVLSEQTKKLTSDITRIINNLELNATQAENAAEEVVIQIKEENELISNTENHYHEINEQISGLSQSVSTLQEHIDQIFESNNQIVDSITQLSASSEEVNASTEKVVNISEINREKTRMAKELLNGLLEEARKLDTNNSN
ncbi:methyl-accepting chemotaxis protein [Anaerosporobacter faecicola]|uniref:methyl-accepting chemotaxis protein n=1 Tax=Anaerosporobacter faecicola TaxID=2718714 RepID=UPI00143A865A|nr:methyl-accepting chemotaxis protein [Anaerosporobacter faecicola]